MEGGWFVGEAVRAVRAVGVVGTVVRCEVDEWFTRVIGWGQTATEGKEMVGGEIWARLWE